MQNWLKFLIQFGTSIPKVRNSFKFLNVWADKDDFLGIIEDAWCNPVEGTPMYRFTRILSLLKPKLKSLNCHHTRHISRSMIEMKAQWDATQVLLDRSSYYVEYMDAERGLVK
ncbi:hypothetical protein NC652_029554 [Populus alba x Populus x berolinensis]|nr:hypothetical protein NC652_029554 [Populus alba x Populus x berolinensis]